MPSPYHAERILEPEVPTDLARVVAVLERGTSDPTFRVESTPSASRVVLTARISESDGRGVAALVEQGPRVSHNPSNGGVFSRALCPIRARVWGEDPAEVEAVAASLPNLVGAYDDWEGFAASDEYRLIPAEIRSAFRQHPGTRLAATGWVFKHAITAIFEQRVTGAEAIGAWQRLIRSHGTPPPPVPEPLRRQGVRFPGDMRVFPTPSDWLAIPSWEWRSLGVDAHRRETVRRVAEAAATLAHLNAHGGPGELARALAAIPGVGPWTVAETMQRSHGLPDAVSVGDYHLAHGVTQALEGVRGDDTRMLELLAPWRGNRQRVVRMITALGLREQRRGPRVAPERHRFY